MGQPVRAFCQQRPDQRQGRSEFFPAYFIMGIPAMEPVILLCFCATAPQKDARKKSCTVGHLWQRRVEFFTVLLIKISTAALHDYFFSAIKYDGG